MSAVTSVVIQLIRHGGSLKETDSNSDFSGLIKLFDFMDTTHGRYAHVLQRVCKTFF